MWNICLPLSPFLLAPLLSSIRQRQTLNRVHFPGSFCHWTSSWVKAQKADHLHFLLAFPRGAAYLLQFQHPWTALLRCQILPGDLVWAIVTLPSPFVPKTVGKSTFPLLLISGFPHFSLIGFSAYSINHVINTLHWIPSIFKTLNDVFVFLFAEWTLTDTHMQCVQCFWTNMFMYTWGIHLTSGHSYILSKAAANGFF